MEKFDLRSAKLEAICNFIENLGEKRFRGEQIFVWINEKFVESIDEMTNLSQELRQKLMQYAEISQIDIERLQESKDGTKKFLFKLQNYGMMDGEGVNVEAVLMEYRHGLSVCLSSQAGCRMGCDFCATGTTGLIRNLTAGEIAAQLYKISKHTGRRISNIVLMGMGEPLDNYDNIIKFIHLINHPKGVNIGQRHITLSTSGLVDKIADLANEDLQINLAISLHAPNDQIRRQIMPIARKYSIKETIDACREYSKNGRRITFEYIMLDGINDTMANAQELSKHLKGINCLINLIPANEIPYNGYKKSKPHKVVEFKETLEKAGHTVTQRRELGADISAACGQLRNEHK
ncbi:MAG: 23S rRNA (adenine(2503)-C(2))-methyltransferase RlmN [Defluviitaleaceae bacterium]|nr:23S rRNA (adenine(2503)-C(2))-methyltransferase RlmN [Defluviitaleaceae bacterium]